MCLVSSLHVKVLFLTFLSLLSCSLAHSSLHRPPPPPSPLSLSLSLSISLFFLFLSYPCLNFLVHLTRYPLYPALASFLPSFSSFPLPASCCCTPSEGIACTLAQPPHSLLSSPTPLSIVFLSVYFALGEGITKSSLSTTVQQYQGTCIYINIYKYKTYKIYTNYKIYKVYKI